MENYAPDRKRKAKLLSDDVQCEEPSEKRRRLPDTTGDPFADRVRYWVQEGRWAQKYFEPDPNMSRQPPKRSRSSSQGEQSNPSSTTPSDQKPRDEKSAPYKDSRYKTLLELKGSYMHPSKLGPTDNCKSLCKALLVADQPFPENSRFDDDIFENTCEKIVGKNEARVIKEIALLVVPSAEDLASRNSKLDGLIEGVNEGWNKSIAFQGPRPQPDYSVGFRRTVFTADQLKKLDPRFDIKTHFTATEEIHFPFFTCEVKCGNQAIDIADRQNAHNMTVAAKGVVELYRTVKRQEELHRVVLAFSISHNNRYVRIFAHYAETEEEDAKFFRYPIKSFDITSEDGKDKWTAYNFTRNVYEKFVPIHLERLKSAINQLPDFSADMLESNVSTTPSLQEIATSAPSSQGLPEFKVPDLPRGGAPKPQTQERQFDQLLELLRQQERLLEQQTSRSDSLERLLEQQSGLLKQQSEQLRQLSHDSS